MFCTPACTDHSGGGGGGGQPRMLIFLG